MIVSAACAIPVLAPLAHAQEQPPGFVALADIDATIGQDLRYATANNFTGAKVPGYTTGACLLTRPAAAALVRVQKDLLAEGLSLKVYDCYRPAMATNAFVEWANQPASWRPDGSDPLKRYHPRLARGSLIPAGYISADSNHTRGTTVDVTLVDGTVDGSEARPAVTHDCGAEPDGSVDMGTGYDCLDAKSHLGAVGLTRDQQLWRQKLAAAMRRHGFRGYFREWWHFTFAGGR